MHITILTLFPAMFQGPFSESMVKRGVARGLIDVRVINIRDYTTDKHHVVDDAPFGGGPGMVMKPEPIFDAVEAARGAFPEAAAHVILLTPQGTVFNQQQARRLALKPHLIFICGHYEGVDERVHEHLADEELSLGDFVLTGGEPAAIAITDAVVRLVPGVLGDPESGASDTFAVGLIQYPQYTRPRVFRGWEAPDILLSGDHAEVARWRRAQSIRRTLDRRPELLALAGIPPQESEAARRELGGRSNHQPEQAGDPPGGERL